MIECNVITIKFCTQAFQNRPLIKKLTIRKQLDNAIVKSFGQNKLLSQLIALYTIRENVLLMVRHTFVCFKFNLLINLIYKLVDFINFITCRL